MTRYQTHRTPCRQPGQARDRYPAPAGNAAGDAPVTFQAPCDLSKEIPVKIKKYLVRWRIKTPRNAVSRQYYISSYVLNKPNIGKYVDSSMCYMFRIFKNTTYNVNNFTVVRFLLDFWEDSVKIDIHFHKKAPATMFAAKWARMRSPIQADHVAAHASPIHSLFDHHRGRI